MTQSQASDKSDTKASLIPMYLTPEEAALIAERRSREELANGLATARLFKEVGRVAGEYLEWTVLNGALPLDVDSFYGPAGFGYVLPEDLARDYSEQLIFEMIKRVLKALAEGISAELAESGSGEENPKPSPQK